MPGFGEVCYSLLSPVGTIESNCPESVVPPGLCLLVDVFDPSVKTLGYSQMSLRDRPWPVNGYTDTRFRRISPENPTAGCPHFLTHQSWWGAEPRGLQKGSLIESIRVIDPETAGREH